ncbi:MAG: hypothetical protein WAM39_03840 [Bryobacteraceae bacterium]
MKHVQALMTGLMLAVAVAAAQQPGSKDRNGVAFDLLKSLQGGWEGKAVDSGREMPVTTTFQLVSGGSVSMNDLAPGRGHLNKLKFMYAQGRCLTTVPAVETVSELSCALRER